MSRHSKWSTIKRAKASNDAKRGQLFTKLSKEIIVAAKNGGANLDSNFRLRMAVQKAKDNNMPSDNIDRAIKRAVGDGSNSDMEEIVYEGYGPGGTAILVQTVTDNRKRTGSQIRAIFTKSGGSLAEVGAVAWQFNQKCVISVNISDEKQDELALLCIDAGADDFESSDSSFDIFCALDKVSSVQDIIDPSVGNTSVDISMMANNTVMLDDSTSMKILKLLDEFEDSDDVQKVFTNADFSEEVLNSYQNNS